MESLTWAPLPFKSDHRKRKTSDGPGNPEFPLEPSSSPSPNPLGRQLSLVCEEEDEELCDEPMLLANATTSTLPLKLEGSASPTSLSSSTSSSSHVPQVKRRSSISLESPRDPSSPTGTVPSSNSGSATSSSVIGGASASLLQETLSSPSADFDRVFSTRWGVMKRRKALLAGMVLVTCGFVLWKMSVPKVEAVVKNEITEDPKDEFEGDYGVNAVYKEEQDPTLTGVTAQNHIGRVLVITFFCVGALACVVVRIYRKYMAPETVLMAHGDDELNGVIEKARAEWQAGRFAGDHSDVSPHLVPNAVQRAWAAQSIASLETV